MQSDGVLQSEGLRLMAAGRTAEAEGAFLADLERDWKDSGAKFALKTMRWWGEALKNAEGAAGEEKAWRIYGMWDRFYKFIRQAGGIDRRALDALRSWIGAVVIENFNYNRLDMVKAGDRNLRFALAASYKGVGDYENAASFLSAAHGGSKKREPRELFEMADILSLAGRNQEAAVHFKEVFLKDPLAVDAYSMASPLYSALYEETKRRGVEEEFVPLWMPVWGVLLGMFRDARILSGEELGNLQARIFEKENELGGERRREALPVLLNCYIWLREHYIKSGNMKSAEITELKIKLADGALHNLLTGGGA